MVGSRQYPVDQVNLVVCPDIGIYKLTKRYRIPGGCIYPD
jgi:hypothetical protein